MKVQKNNDLGINVKGLFKQFLCKHKNKEVFSEKSKSGFVNISGEKRHVICKDCGYHLESYFSKYEGGGFK